jgi:hypothetical protein
MKQSPMRGGLAALLLTVLSACAMSPEDGAATADSGIEIAGIIIRNDLAYPVTDVMVEVPATRRFAGCGNILPRSQCSTALPEAAYRQNAITIRWREYGREHAMEPFVVRVPDSMPEGTVAWLMVLVYAPGQAGAKLVTDPGP